MKRRISALLLCAALILSAFPATAAGKADPSDWAVNAVTWLRGTGKLTDADFTGYDRVVTRLDFARLAVVLYELITGMPKPDPSDVKNPFSDTNDLDALRAYKIKVVNGTGDGSLDILAASYTVQCLDAATGSLKWRFPAGKDRNATTDGASPSPLRTWPGLYVGDIDGDGHNEIVAGHGSSLLQQGVLAVYDENGYFKPGWPQTLPNEVYSVAVADLDGDGTMEIAAGVGVSDGQSVYVYEHDGSLRPGWPQLDAAHDGNKTQVLPESDPKAPSLGYSWGIFNDNIAVGDIDGDGKPEIVAPADMGQICAYKPDGSQVRTNMRMDYGKNFGVTEKVVWGRVGAFSDADYESKVYNGGFGRANDLMGDVLNISSLSMSERLTAHFTHSKAVIADLDGNGKSEVVVVGDVHDRADEGKASLPHLYHELFVFNGDRTRFNAAWATQPSAKNGPLCPLTDSDWETMDRCMPDPVCADLDGDGKLEILYPDFSGKLNCYWLDHTQHGSWPINVYDGSTMEYASAPTVCDLNGDGKPEVIFTTYTQKTGSKKGSLCIADANGALLQQVTLPDAADTSSATPNGCMAAPVVVDMDGDGKLEIVLQTYLSGVTVYDLT